MTVYVLPPSQLTHLPVFDVTADSAPRPGDSHEELDAIPVPTFIDTTDPELATTAGVRRVIR